MKLSELVLVWLIVAAFFIVVDLPGPVPLIIASVVTLVFAGLAYITRKTESPSNSEEA